MAITERDFEAAKRRGAAPREASAVVHKARHDRRSGRVVLTLASGLQVAFLPRDVRGLAQALPAQLAAIEISPSGLGLHFPALDADVYVPALLEGFFGTQRWMAAHHVRQGGQASTAAKQQAARSNGRLGGRRRKAEPTA